MNNIVITKGGEYNGQFSSDRQDQAAIHIDTTEEVVLNGFNITGIGPGITAINGANITVVGGSHYGANPNIKGETHARFIDVERAARLVVMNNYMRETAGIRAKYCKSVHVSKNDVFVIQGLKSDGNGGYLKEGPGDASKTRQFIIMRKGENMIDTEISWNRIVSRDQYGWYGQVEDVINLNSSGVEGKPIRVFNNLIVGAYGANADTPEKYTGGGIISDGWDNNHLDIFGNYVIGVGNYGLSFAGGKNIDFHDNTVISSAQLPGGGMIGYSSTGLSFQLAKSPEGVYMRNNRVAWVNTRPAGSTPGRNDTNFNTAEDWQVQGNVSLIPGELFGLDYEQQFIDEWERFASEKGVLIGISGGVTPPPVGTDPAEVEALKATIEELKAVNTELKAANQTLQNEIETKTALIQTLENDLKEAQPKAADLDELRRILNP